MPRSLKLPVGFMPSNFRCVSISEPLGQAGRGIKGVEPSSSVTTGRSARAATGPGSARSGESGLAKWQVAQRTNSSSITLIERGGARSRSSLEISSTASVNRPSATRCMHHHEPRVLPHPLLHDALHAHAVLARGSWRSARARRAVLDLEMEIERRLDLLPGNQAQLFDRIEVHALGAHHRHDVAEHRGGCLRPAGPGPDSVTSVIAGDSSVTALKGPTTDASGWPP